MTNIDPAEYGDKDFRHGCELIGRFFYHWAGLEYTINNAIKRLFNIDGVQSHILTANMQFRDRLHIVSTALNFHGLVKGEEWRRRAKKTVARISRLNRNRNLFAHTMFTPLKGGRIDFFYIEAKGSFNIPDTLWHPKQFECQFDLILRAEKELRSLTDELKNTQAIVKALLSAPSGGTAPREMGGLLGLSSLTLQSYPVQTAIPETDPQTPPDPQPIAENPK